MVTVHRATDNTRNREFLIKMLLTLNKAVRSDNDAVDDYEMMLGAKQRRQLGGDDNLLRGIELHFPSAHSSVYIHVV
jgi:hypothetical protein